MPDYKIGRLNGQFVLIYRDSAGKRHRYRLGTDARQAALDAPSIYADLIRPRGTNVEALWNAYVRDKEGRAITVTMGHTWKAVGPSFGSLPGDAVTIADCRGHTARRRACGIQDGTIYTELGHLRTVLVWAARHKHITNPSVIERPAKPKPRENHLTHTEVRALANACTMPHLRLFVHLAYATAGRASAILGLTWDRVDFERGKIDLEDPGLTAPHKGRAIVPMTRTLRAALLESQKGALSSYVIEWAGERVSSVKKGLAAAAKRAGLRHVSAHMLRHSAAVRLAEASTPMEEIASYLGHTNTAITRRVYARYSPDHLRGAAGSLELDDLGDAQKVRKG